MDIATKENMFAFLLPAKYHTPRNRVEWHQKMTSYKKMTNDRPVYTVIGQYGEIYTDLSLFILSNFALSHTPLKG